jgi:hypothetical protein
MTPNGLRLLDGHAPDRLHQLLLLHARLSPCFRRPPTAIIEYDVPHNSFEPKDTLCTTDQGLCSLCEAKTVHDLRPLFSTRDQASLPVIWIYTTRYRRSKRTSSHMVLKKAYARLS